MTDHKTAETIAFWDPVSWACCLGIGLLSTLLLIALTGVALFSLMALLARLSLRNWHESELG